MIDRNPRPREISDMGKKWIDVLLIGGSLSLFCGGCTITKMTEPPRSASEQLLLSTAADRAIAKADLRRFADQKVFLDNTNFDSYDPKYVIGSIRDALSRAGALLVSSPAQ